ncbi:MAG TPA: hypothetical protein VJ891_10070 [Casimicrobiaceae bacterium]|nr:hypothetical protein [Casimicrobiaceae bacterium]
MSGVTCTTDHAVFQVEHAQDAIDQPSRLLADLKSELRTTLPEPLATRIASAIDVAKECLDQANEAADAVKTLIMDHGLPVDDVACSRCDSPEFLNVETCEECRTVRADDKLLQRRLAGWHA